MEIENYILNDDILENLFEECVGDLAKLKNQMCKYEMIEQKISKIEVYTTRISSNLQSIFEINSILNNFIKLKKETYTHETIIMEEKLEYVKKVRKYLSEIESDKMNTNNNQFNLNNMNQNSNSNKINEKILNLTANLNKKLMSYNSMFLNKNQDKLIEGNYEKYFKLLFDIDEYLLGKFNDCRSIYEVYMKEMNELNIKISSSSILNKENLIEILKKTMNDAKNIDNMNGINEAEDDNNNQINLSKSGKNENNIAPFSIDYLKSKNEEMSVLYQSIKSLNYDICCENSCISGIINSQNINLNMSNNDLSLNNCRDLPSHIKKCAYCDLVKQSIENSVKLGFNKDLKITTNNEEYLSTNKKHNDLSNMSQISLTQMKVPDNLNAPQDSNLSTVNNVKSSLVKNLQYPMSDKVSNQKPNINEIIDSTTNKDYAKLSENKLNKDIILEEYEKEKEDLQKKNMIQTEKLEGYKKVNKSTFNLIGESTSNSNNMNENNPKLKNNNTDKKDISPLKKNIEFNSPFKVKDEKEKINIDKSNIKNEKSQELLKNNTNRKINENNTIPKSDEKENKEVHKNDKNLNKQKKLDNDNNQINQSIELNSYKKCKEDNENNQNINKSNSKNYKIENLNDNSNNNNNNPIENNIIIKSELKDIKEANQNNKREIKSEKTIINDSNLMEDDKEVINNSKSSKINDLKSINKSNFNTDVKTNCNSNINSNITEPLIHQLNDLYENNLDILIDKIEVINESININIEDNNKVEINNDDISDFNFQTKSVKFPTKNNEDKKKIEMKFDANMNTLDLDQIKEKSKEFLNESIRKTSIKNSTDLKYSSEMTTNNKSVIIKEINFTKQINEHQDIALKVECSKNIVVTNKEETKVVKNISKSVLKVNTVSSFTDIKIKNDDFKKDKNPINSIDGNIMLYEKSEKGQESFKLSNHKDIADKSNNNSIEKSSKISGSTNYLLGLKDKVISNILKLLQTSKYYQYIIKQRMSNNIKSKTEEKNKTAINSVLKRKLDFGSNLKSNLPVNKKSEGKSITKKLFSDRSQQKTKNNQNTNELLLDENQDKKVINHELNANSNFKKQKSKDFSFISKNSFRQEIKNALIKKKPSNKNIINNNSFIKKLLFPVINYHKLIYDPINPLSLSGINYNNLAINFTITLKFENINDSLQLSKNLKNKIEQFELYVNEIVLKNYNFICFSIKLLLDTKQNEVKLNIVISGHVITSLDDFFTNLCAKVFFSIDEGQLSKEMNFDIINFNFKEDLIIYTYHINKNEISFEKCPQETLYDNFKFIHNNQTNLQELKQIKNKLAFIVFCRNEISNIISLKVESKI